MANAVTINTNELFEAGAFSTIPRTDGKTSMKEIVVANVLADYNYGIKNASTNNFPQEIKNEIGVVKYSFKGGEIPPLNTIYKIRSGNKPIAKNRYGNEILWRMTGYTFTYDGQPLIRREFIEVKE